MFCIKNVVLEYTFKLKNRQRFILKAFFMIKKGFKQINFGVS